MAQQSQEDTLAQAKEMGLELNADGSAWIPISKSDVDDAHKSEKRKLNSKELVHIIVLSFSGLLAIVAILGSSWISVDISGYSTDAVFEFGLNSVQGQDDSEIYAETCDDSTGDSCAAARAGLVATIGLSIGIFLLLLCCMDIFLRTKGFGLLSVIPLFGKAIIQWGAGISMLLGIGFWLITWGFYWNSSMEEYGQFGIHFWMALLAACLGLITPILNKFVFSEDLDATSK
jgi:hypothetical protein